MKLKQMTFWYGKSGLASLGVYYGIMFILYGAYTVTLLSGRQDIQTNGLGMALAILLLVQGIVCFGQNLRFGMANGVSRRSVFFSYLLYLLPAAVLTAVFNELLLLLVSLASHDMADVLYFLYDGYIQQAGAFAGHLAVVLATVCMSLQCGMLGYLIGGAF